LIRSNGVCVYCEKETDGNGVSAKSTNTHVDEKITKKCWSCKTVLPLSYFWKNKSKADGFSNECKTCSKAKVNAWKARTGYKPNSRAITLSAYRLTEERYAELLEAQQGVCALCHKPETVVKHGKVQSLSVDHDHATGDVRGLLCSRCNTAIAVLDNFDEAWHDKAKAYRERKEQALCNS
jgi:hypothetical protein